MKLTEQQKLEQQQLLTQAKAYTTNKKILKKMLKTLQKVQQDIETHGQYQGLLHPNDRTKPTQRKLDSILQKEYKTHFPTPDGPITHKYNHTTKTYEITDGIETIILQNNNRTWYEAQKQQYETKNA
jgi:hypothetical protein